MEAVFSRMTKHYCNPCKGSNIRKDIWELLNENETLTGCVEKRVNRKMQLVSLARWKDQKQPSDVFAFCVKEYAGLWCQAPMNGKVFCMVETPCWKSENKEV
jgi:hypothetical protein